MWIDDQNERKCKKWTFSGLHIHKERINPSKECLESTLSGITQNIGEGVKETK